MGCKLGGHEHAPHRNGVFARDVTETLFLDDFLWLSMKRKVTTRRQTKDNRASSLNREVRYFEDREISDAGQVPDPANGSRKKTQGFRWEDMIP